MVTCDLVCLLKHDLSCTFGGRGGGGGGGAKLEVLGGATLEKGGRKSCGGGWTACGTWLGWWSAQRGGVWGGGGGGGGGGQVGDIYKLLVSAHWQMRRRNIAVAASGLCIPVVFATALIKNAC